MTAVRWLLTGAGGMVGRDLCDALRSRGEDLVAYTHEDLDITTPRMINALVEETRPAIIINCAAYTKVDAAEENESIANAVNGSAVEFLAYAADAAGALLVQISTDFVFDGAQRRPYEINDQTNPQSVYGRSKLLGEFAASHARRYLVIRTSWLFGVHGPNFVEAIRNQILKGTTTLRVVNDQRGRPTYTPHLANAIIRASRLAHDSADARGMLHYADEDECTWFDFAKAIVEESGATTDVRPVTTDEFPRPATRPPYSVLSTERYERLTGVQPESWREGLREYLALRG
jgi:dTDP-4-dehydrorhamnose reductase